MTRKMTLVERLDRKMRRLRVNRFAWRIIAKRPAHEKPRLIAWMIERNP